MDKMNKSDLKKMDEIEVINKIAKMNEINGNNG